MSGENAFCKGLWKIQRAIERLDNKRFCLSKTGIATSLHFHPLLS